MSTPAVCDLQHLRQIIRIELDRATREGQSALYLDGCTRPADRRLVDELVREVAGGATGSGLLYAAPTPWGYAVNFARTSDLPVYHGEDHLISQTFR